jgi:threonine/homoserine/homoserine lactone efflux protein
MSGQPTIILFVAASAALIVTPGPAVLYIVARSVSQGRQAGLVSAAGVGLGNMVHAAVAAAGLSAILASSGLAYSVLKYAGAGYLILLGLRRFFARPAQADEPAFVVEPLRATFRQAVLVGVLNPKTALFFLAFLPQFVVAGRGPIWTQLLALGAGFVVMAMLGDSAYAMLSGTCAAWLHARKRLLGAGRFISGAVYCGLGLVTAISGPAASG